MENEPPKSRQGAREPREIGLKILFADNRDNGAARLAPVKPTRGLITVLLAERSESMRQHLLALLEREPDLKVVAEAGDGATAIRLAHELSPQVAVIDAALPDVNGLEIATRILARSPQVKIVILTLYTDRRLMANLLRAGASGYLLKDSAYEELVRSLRTVAAHEIYLSPQVLNQALQDYVRILRNGDGHLPPENTGKEAPPAAIAAEAAQDSVNKNSQAESGPLIELGARIPFKDLQKRLGNLLALSHIEMD